MRGGIRWTPKSQPFRDRGALSSKMTSVSLSDDFTLDVRAAAGRLTGVAERTPLQRNARLSALTAPRSE